MASTEPSHADGAFSVRTEQDGDVLVVTPSGEIDVSSAEAFGLELRRALSSSASTVLLDLEHVPFLDSTGLGVLLMALKESSKDGQKLRIKRSLSPAVEQMLGVTGLMDSLPWA